MNDVQARGDYPDHLREAAEAIDTLRTERHRAMSRAERAVQHLMDAIGSPRFIIALVIVIVAWVGLNIVLGGNHAPLDSGSFKLLDTMAGLSSLILVVAILSHQNTQGTIEQERTRLILQMLVIGDRKVTQALNALEDLRREHPRIDTSGDATELHVETDLHEAARALQEAEAPDPLV